MFGEDKMAERTGFEPVEERLAPHRFSKPVAFDHSAISPTRFLLYELNRWVNYKKVTISQFFRSEAKFFSANVSP